MLTNQDLEIAARAAWNFPPGNGLAWWAMKGGKRFP